MTDIRWNGQNWSVACDDALDFVSGFEAGSIDAIVTDPPYAATGESSAWVSKDGKRSLPRESQFFEAWIREHIAMWALRLKPTGGMWISCDRVAATAIETACARLGLKAPAVGIWHREGLGMGFTLRHVYECFAVVTMPEWQRRKTNEPDVWVHKWTPSSRTTGHSAEKPVELMSRAIDLLVPAGSLVVDPFSGSGSTGAAALGLGMRYAGCERDDEIAAAQAARLRSITEAAA